MFEEGKENREIASQEIDLDGLPTTPRKKIQDIFFVAKNLEVQDHPFE